MSSPVLHGRVGKDQPRSAEPRPNTKAPIGQSARQHRDPEREEGRHQVLRTRPTRTNVKTSTAPKATASRGRGSASGRSARLSAVPALHHAWGTEWPVVTRPTPCRDRSAIETSLLQRLQEPLVRGLALLAEEHHRDVTSRIRRSIQTSGA